MQIIKDLISLLIYFFITRFYRNKNAVLVYHSVDNIEPDKDPQKININPSLFEKQIKYLSGLRNNYTLSFDDGFESIYINALQILKK